VGGEEACGLWICATGHIQRGVGWADYLYLVSDRVSNLMVNEALTAVWRPSHLGRVIGVISSEFDHENGVGTGGSVIPTLWIEPWSGTVTFGFNSVCELKPRRFLGLDLLSATNEPTEISAMRLARTGETAHRREHGLEEI